MNSVDEAVEAAAKAWHDRSEEKDQEAARWELEHPTELAWESERAYEEYLADCREAVELGPISWEDVGEWGQQYARSKVRQTVLDALPAFLYALADETIVFADGAWTKPDERIHLGWTAGYLKETAEEIKD